MSLKRALSDTAGGSSDAVAKVVQLLESLSDEEVKQILVPPKSLPKDGAEWKLAFRLRRIFLDCGVYYHKEINRLCPTIRTILSIWLSNLAHRHVSETELPANTARRLSRVLEDAGRKSPTPESKELGKLMVERAIATGTRPDFRNYRTAVRLQTASDPLSVVFPEDDPACEDEGFSDDETPSPPSLPSPKKRKP